MLFDHAPAGMHVFRLIAFWIVLTLHRVSCLRGCGVIRFGRVETLRYMTGQTDEYFRGRSLIYRYLSFWKFQTPA